MKPYICFAFLSLLLISCAPKEPAPLPVSIAPGPLSEAPVTPSPMEKKIEYILFGTFYGECGEHCATMFKYFPGGNPCMLWADYTDSYFNPKEEIVCKTQLTDRKKMDLGADILKHIPDTLFSVTKPSLRFGCPDCRDGGGIYFEIKRDELTWKFRIDCQTSNLHGAIKEFAEYLIPRIHQMKKPGN